MLYSRQEYFSGLSISPAMDHLLSEHFTIPVIIGWLCTAWLIDSFLELHKPFYSNKVLIHEVYYIYICVCVCVCIYILFIYIYMKQSLCCTLETHLWLSLNIYFNLKSYREYMNHLWLKNTYKYAKAIKHTFHKMCYTKNSTGKHTQHH